MSPERFQQMINFEADKGGGGFGGGSEQIPEKSKARPKLATGGGGGGMPPEGPPPNDDVKKYLDEHRKDFEEKFEDYSFNGIVRKDDPEFDKYRAAGTLAYGLVLISGVPKDELNKMPISELFRIAREIYDQNRPATASEFDTSKEESQKTVWYDGIIEDLRRATDINVPVERRQPAREELRKHGIDLGEFINEDPDQAENRFLMVRDAVEVLAGSYNPRNNRWGSDEAAERFMEEHFGIKKGQENVQPQETGVKETKREETARPEEPTEPIENKWEKMLREKLEVTDGYPPEDKIEALKDLRKKMVKDGAPAEYILQLKSMIESPELHQKPAELVEFKEEEIADIRTAMLEDVSMLTGGTNLVKSFQLFITNQIYKKGRMAGTLSQELEKTLEREYFARAELWMVTNHWFPISKSMSAEKSAIKEFSVNQIDNCPLLSADTYLWLGEQTRGEEVDKALKFIYDGLDLPKGKGGDFNLWTINTKDSLNKTVEMIVKDGNITNPDSVRLALQIAIAEHWSADKDFEFISHPAYQFMHPEEYMYFQGATGRGITGGKRLWVEAVRQNGGTIPSPENNPFKDKFPPLSKVGFNAWKKGTGQNLIESGNYIRGFKKYWEEVAEKDPLYIPQREVMLSISKGYSAWDALDQVGRVEGPKAVIDSLSSLRGALDSAYFRFAVRPEGSKGDNSTIRMRIAKEMTGRVLLEEARNMVWQISWANPDIVGNEGKVAPLDVLNKLVEDIAFDFKPKENTQLMYGSDISAEQMRLEDGRGFGGFIGYGMDRSRANQEAKNFIRWYYDRVLPVMRRALTVSLVPGINGKDYKVVVSPDRKKKESTNLYVFTEDKYLNKFTTKRIGHALLGAADERWWLREN